MTAKPDTRLVIICDTREQIPFEFSPAVQVVGRTLIVGDYSILGLEDLIVVERKTLSDLLGSITNGRERFLKKLRQMRGYRFAALVVEAEWPAILEGRFPQAVSVNSVIGSLMAFAIKCGVIPIMAKDHATGAVLTERLLLNFARLIERDHRELEKGQNVLPKD